MKRILTLTLSACLLSALIFTAFVPVDKSADGIQWMTLQELDDLNKKLKERKKRPVLIDLYTDWCGWCKRMDANTFAQAEVANYVNEHFFAVKFNAEQKDSVTFNGKTYHTPAGRRGTNRAAVELGAVNGRIGYPTITFLDKNLNRIVAMPGYKGPEDMLLVLEYIADEHYANMTLPQFKAWKAAAAPQKDAGQPVFSD